MTSQATQQTAQHIPVLLDEVIAALAPIDGGVYVDGTFGAGGYTKAILDAAACTVYAIDRDPDAIPRAAAIEAAYPGRLTLLPGRFGDMVALLAEKGVTAVDGVALDIGVSSMQIDEAERGFSFQADGPLDMRMEKSGPTAADIVNDTDETELANLIYKYGEERLSRRIARAIVAARADAPFETTKQLADVIRAAVPQKRGKGGKMQIDPATRTFQALRIVVNDELGELERGLEGAETLLKSGGRLAVVSFHSLEDRIVKTFLRERAGETGGGSRHMPEAKARRQASFSLLGRKAVRPSDAENDRNPRARSSRLRAAVRTEAPAWGPEGGAA